MELEVFYEDLWVTQYENREATDHFGNSIIAVHYIRSPIGEIVYELEDGTFIECDDFWGDWRD